MFYPHNRQLGAQPGVQLNSIRDNSAGFAASPSDQVAAIVGRFKRGRVDAPFVVNSGNMRAKLGPPESIRISALNEAYVQVSDALGAGAYEVVVGRLITDAAINSFAVFSITGAVSAFSVSAVAPSAPYLFYLQHLDCFNDGIKIEVAAEKTLDVDNITSIPAKVITLRLREPNGNLMYEFKGSLDPLAVNEFGKDYFIGSVIAEQTDAVKIVVKDGAVIPIAADCYGKNVDGTAKVATTGANPLVLFSEGGTAYTASNYDKAIAMLENGSTDFGYLMSGGSQAVALVSKLGQLAIRSNRQFAFDIPGTLSPAAAIAFIAQLGFDSHYCQGYWAPLMTDDPVNGGKAVIGTSGYNVGRRCARNQQINAYGFAPKNVPVAGKDWALARTGVKQIANPTEFDLSDLATAKINPVLYERYIGGGKFVFTDSLTCAKSSASALKLISVAEMSSSIDDIVSKFGKEVLQLPMDIALKRTDKFLEKTFDALGSSGWLVASDDPELGEKGYAYTVSRNPLRPADRMDISYGTHFDGVVRALFVTQTLSR